jgi:hypothetical protein
MVTDSFVLNIDFLSRTPFYVNDVLSVNGLVHVIHEPTHFTVNSSSSIDPILVSIHGLSLCLTSIVLRGIHSLAKELISKVNTNVVSSVVVINYGIPVSI